MSDEPKLPALPPTAEKRDIVVQRLTQAYAAGRIEMEELERRLDIAMRAQTMAELTGTLAGLEAPKPQGRESEEVAQVPAPPFRVDHPKASKRTVCVLSGAHRRGRWVPARDHKVFVVMGGAKLDLRDAELFDGLTEITVNVLMGGVQIIVPPDVDVEMDGWAFMGSNDQRDIHPAPLEVQTRRVRIYARTIMGGVEIRVKARKSATPAEVGEGDELEVRRRRKKIRGGGE